MLPFAVLMFAIVAAFAAQAKEVNGSFLEDAYLPPQIWGQPCEQVQIECSTNNLNPICQDDDDRNLFGLADPKDETSCVVPLYRP